MRFNPTEATLQRIFIGLWSTFAAPTSTADMLASRNGIGLWLDTGVSPNWKVMHNDGTGASVVDTLGAGIPISAADLHQVEIITDNANSKFVVRLQYPTNNYISQAFSTDIPGTGVQYGFLISIETLTGSAKYLYLYDMELEIRA